MRANLDLYSHADNATAYLDQEDVWLEEGYAEVYALPGYGYSNGNGHGYDYDYPAPGPHLIDYLNPQALVMGLVLLLFLYAALQKPAAHSSPQASGRETAVIGQSSPAVATAPAAPNPLPGGDFLTFVAPYTDYRITQGLHGYSYGHMAIDLAAGRGEPVLSPINGSVTASYLDEYGNTTLIIENEIYTITMLHGEYSVRVGDSLSAGQQVGVESNKGYTMDMAGNLCYNREWCGNHTHLNVYDKRLNANVNPLDLFGR
jgi:murein DD-endopeptidase MepM/ murein hydrolase activator NlpD